MKASIKRLRSKFLSLFVGLICINFAASTALGEGNTPEETLAWCKNLAIEASQMAFEAQVTCDYPMANLALSLVDEAAYHVARVSRHAQNTENSQLGLSAYNACNQVEVCIDDVIRAAQHIASNSPNPDVVHASKFLLDACEQMKNANKSSMEIALRPLWDIALSAEVYSK